MTFYNNIITSGLELHADDSNFKRVRMVNFILYLSVVINALLIKPNIENGLVIYPIVGGLVVLIGIVGVLLLRRGIHYIPLTSQLSILIMFMVQIPALFEGGIANSGFVWFFLLPLVSVIVLGVNRGMWWIYLLFVVETAAYLFLDQSTLPYEKEFLIYHMLSIAVGTYFIRYLQETLDLVENNLIEKNAELNYLTQNLRDEVKRAIDASRKKDLVIIQEAKMADMGRMLSNVSHQWKQPLSTLTAIISRMQFSRELDQPLDIDGGLTELLRQTTLMEETMKEFLGFSQPHIKDEVFHVSSAIKSMLLLIESTFNYEDITITYRNNAQHPFIYGAKGEFIHAIMNIANNAKDALLENKVKGGKIMISLSDNDDECELRLSDNAGGIPAGVIEHVFEPYFTTKSDHGGTGLGLDLSKQVIVEHFHGSISVENTEEGALFIIKLPLKHPEKQATVQYSV